MPNVLPDPNAPKESTDAIYGERMEPYEDRMNFFQGKKVELKKDNVADVDASDVSGLEAIINRFSTYTHAKPLAGLEDGVELDSVAGTESLKSKAKALLSILVQMAKEVVAWLVEMATNRIRRVDVRLYRTALERKRAGLASNPQKYPAGIRRLIVPAKLSIDGNWVAAALGDALAFYKGAIKAYRFMNTQIRDLGDGFVLSQEMNKTIAGVAGSMGLTSSGNGYISQVLPGSRQFRIDNVVDTQSDQINMYYADAIIDVRLKSPTFTPTSFMIDNTFNQIKTMLKEIQSNQSTMSQLSRQFERRAAEMERSDITSLSSDQRRYYNWLVRFNKRLMNMSVQFIVNTMDAGLDFCQAGINK